MSVLIPATLVVIGVVAAVVGVRVVRRRIEVWADAMILSFGLPPADAEQNGFRDDLSHCGSAPRTSGNKMGQSTREVDPAESEQRESGELIHS